MAALEERLERKGVILYVPLLERLEEKLVAKIKDSEVEALRKVSVATNICGSTITAHYVVLENRMFAVSVAHAPCYLGDELPSLLLFCPELDISLWKGCPPSGASLLNISSRIALARLGDTVTVFGFADGVARTWSGSIASYVGKTSIGRHSHPNPSEHAEELVFQGAQERGMSGGAAINGVGYLGVARAVQTDSIGNKLPVITPFHLFRTCIKTFSAQLAEVGSCNSDYDIVQVPTMRF
eukprot:gene31650-38250_t